MHTLQTRIPHTHRMFIKAVPDRGFGFDHNIKVLGVSVAAFVHNFQQYQKTQPNRKRNLKPCCPHTMGKTTGLCNAATKCKDSNIHIFLLQTNNYRESTPYREMLTKIELAQFVHRRKKKVKRNGDSKCSHT